MIALAAATTVDASRVVVPILLGLIAFAALYVWTALALSAVFRKSGEESWKAWVPVLNVVVLLQLGGLSGWLVLLALIPIVGALALWVAQVVACYRINVSFGYGAGMTVLAALLFPVWATVVGFGSARWLGAEQAPGARRSTIEPVETGTAASSADAGPPPKLQTSAAVGGWAPSASAPASPAEEPVPPVPPPPAPSPSSAPASAASASEAPEEPISFVPLTSASAPPAAAPTAAAPTADAPPVPPLPDDVLAEPSAPAPASRARANQGWGGFDLGAVGELTSEVTAAVAGAPSPVSAVPRDDPGAAAPTPAVTRVPAARPASGGEPWAPSRSPFPESDAFPEASGEVSAVVGAPNAGIPRSARASVSAQHVRPDVPESEVDHTVVANRRKAQWALVLPTGSSVTLVADIVLVGRRPAPSTAYPDAQLVEVHDGTVSKTHLRLERDGDDWSVTDLHSTNGTVLIASDGAEREIPPGAAHRAAARLLLGDAELRLAPDDASR